MKMPLQQRLPNNLNNLLHLKNQLKEKLSKELLDKMLKD
jgi:hypothetical protein